MKRIWEKKEYIAIGIIVLLFFYMSFTSISAIRMLQGNARVVNYVGIVRGATQKLIKEEIMGWYLSQNDESFAAESEWYPNDALVNRLESIVIELQTGVGPNGLVVLQDKSFLSNMRLVNAHWDEIKMLIDEVRAGADPEELFASSKAYFELVNDTVFSAESYSEAQVDRTYIILVLVSGVFVVLIITGLVLYVRSLAVKRRADILGKIAYVDTLTRLDNRASCERLIVKLTSSPEDKDIAVVMFDMNDLKLTNDFLGHKGGDRVIAAFAAILKEATNDNGFIGRYGGDEFLAIFEDGDCACAEAFLQKVSEKVEDFNANQVNNLEKIRYAAGYTIANPSERNIEDIVHEADNRMYQDKRKLKGLI